MIRSRAVAAAALGLAAAVALLEGGVRLAEEVDWLPPTADLQTRLAAQANPAAAAALPELAAEQLTNNLVLHPYLGFAIDPDLARADGFPNGVVNELGLLGADPLAPAPPGSARVLVLGGSFAAQLCNREGAALSRAVAGHPAIGARPVHLDCAALGSARQPQQLLTLAYLASLGATFDLILTIDGFNDVVVPVTFNHRKGIFRAYPHGWDRRVGGIPDRTELVAIGRLAALDEERVLLANRVYGSGAQRSAALLQLWALRDDRLGARRASLALALEAPADTGRSWVVTGARIPQPDADAARTQAVADWQTGARLLDHFATALGADSLHVLQPNQYLEGSQNLAVVGKSIDPEHFYADAARRGYPQLVGATANLAAQGVPILDLTLVFREATLNPWSDACCHLTDPGYRQFAEALGAAIGRLPQS